MDEREYLFVVADQRSMEVWEVEAYPHSHLLEWLEFFRRKYPKPKE